MKRCLECDKEFDESQRKSLFWKRRYDTMGACADLCDACWKKEYHIDVKGK